MGKYHGIGGFRIGKVGNERYYLRKSSNVVAVAKPYRAINSQWIKQEEFKEYILSLLNVAIPQVYLLDALPEEIFPYALLFVQNENALGVYLDKDGVRTQLQLGGGGGGEYTGSDPISVDQYVKRIRLKMGSGLRLDEDGRLVSEGEGGGEYVGEAPVVIDAETRTISVTRYNTQASWNEQREEDVNLLGSGIIKKNVESKVSKAGVQAPLSINANDELVLGVGSGLELNSEGTNLQVRLGSGLKFDGTYHVTLEDKISYEYGYQIVDGLSVLGVSSITVQANRTYEYRCTRSAIRGSLPEGWEPVPNAPLTLNDTTTSFVIIGSGGVVGPTGVIMYLRNIGNESKTLNVLTFCLPCRKVL